jgi:SNF2 family DNA or RNA helicase
MGGKVYDRWSGDLPEVTMLKTDRLPMYAHQITMLRFALRGRWVILACEMGTGKTRVFIELMEIVEQLHGLTDDEVWYIGPKSGVKAVGLELRKWDTKFRPVMMTYQGLVKVLRDWKPGDPAPKVVCFDESSKVKNPSAQRSQAAKALADAVREEWGDESYIIEMTGTPAPKNPVDWWHQCEIAAPGFVKEGTKQKFKARLCIIEQRESISGAKFPHIVTWLDDENKCADCGDPVRSDKHTKGNSHPFKASKNEVSYLYERMNGLVLVQRKKDLLDLPDLQYQRLNVKPSIETLRAARLIRAKTTRAVTAIMLLRELSDGFQYTEKVVGTQPCPNCEGAGRVEAPVPIQNIDVMEPQDVKPENFETRVTQCPLCDGQGSIDKRERITVPVPCPKDDAFIDLLDEHEDIGRFIVWGGFTATIDRLVEIAHKHGWYTLRVDKQGYIGQDPHGESVDSDELLTAMDATHPNCGKFKDKICFVGNPKAAGHALTLTAAPTMLYFSNTFDGEARMQSEQRHHRLGMDVNRGATIIDLIHLPSDLVILNNLAKKVKLQNLTMGVLDEAFAKYEAKQ